MINTGGAGLKFGDTGFAPKRHPFHIDNIITAQVALIKCFIWRLTYEKDKFKNK